VLVQAYVPEQTLHGQKYERRIVLSSLHYSVDLAQVRGLHVALGVAPPVACSLRADGLKNVHASTSRLSSRRGSVDSLRADLVFSSAEDAQAALDALIRAGHAATTPYNSTPLEKRGWVVAEQVAAQAMAAHLTRLKTLPADLRQAEMYRPKLIDITQHGAPRADVPAAAARELFTVAHAKLQSASFRNDADRHLVRRLLFTLDRMMHNLRSNVSISDARHRVELAYDARIKYLTRRFARQCVHAPLTNGTRRVLEVFG
jgi:hypothetical protein